MAVTALQIRYDRPRSPEGFISLAEAAARLNVDPGNLARKCREDYEPRHMARKFGNVWHVRREIDARLGGPSFEQRDLDQIAVLRKQGILPRHIALAEAKRQIVLGMDEITPSTAGKVADLETYIARVLDSELARDAGITKLSLASLYNYRSAYYSLGIAGLVRKPDSRASSSPIGPLAWEQFLNVLEKKKISKAYRFVADSIVANGLAGNPDWTWPSYRTVLKHYADAVPQGAKILIQQGPHKFNASLPKIARSFEDIRAGTVLAGDQRTFDFQARVPSGGEWKRCRLKLTAWIDVRSRMIVGWHIGKSANSDTILSAFMMAVDRMETLPDSIVIDNGTDYRSVAGRMQRNRAWDSYDAKRVTTAFERLSIEAHYAIARSPWSKGVIESRFHTIKDGFDVWFASYWGGTPDERPWDAEAWTKTRIDLLPTVPEVIEAFAEYLDALHEEEVKGDGAFGLCARQIFAQYYRTDPRPCPKDTLRYYCLPMHGPVKVGRDGVRHNSTLYGKFDQAVWRLRDKEVYYLADPIHAEVITICDKNGVPVCEAFADNNIGQTTEEVRAAMSERRKMTRVAKDYHQRARKTLLSTPVQQIARMRRENARAQQTPDNQLPAPPQTETIRIVNPEVAAGAARVAKASGAEAMRRLRDGNDAARRLNTQIPRRFVNFAELNADADGDEAPDRQDDGRHHAAGCADRDGHVRTGDPAGPGNTG